MSYLRTVYMITLIAAVLGASAAVKADPARVDSAFTSWDSIFFYAAFSVRDANVISLNNSLTSHPQQDDDIEVYLETDGARKVSIRTSTTYEMAVSADNGAYFSVGNGTLTPTPKSIFDYKFASYVDGPLNGGGKDRGYTVELAIPWTELGLSGPPAAGTIWGFNVISRDRASLDRPAHTVYALSPNVRSAQDIQDPSKWTQITFVADAISGKSTEDSVICPKVLSAMPPVVDGTISAGEYATASGFSFGTLPFDAEAPSPQQEPNVGDATPPSVAPPTPAPTVAPAPSTPTPAVAAPVPAQTNPIAGPTISVIPRKKHRSADTQSPLASPFGPAPVPAAKNPILFLPNANNPEADVLAPGAPVVDTTIRPPLPAEPQISARMMAKYVLDETLESSLDQPESGIGPCFGAGCEQAIANQLRNARLSGIEFLLPVFSGSGTDIKDLRSVVQTLKAMDQGGDDYPLLGLYLTGSGDSYETIKAFFAIVPPQFRGQVFLSDENHNRRAYVIVADRSVDSQDVCTRFEHDFGDAATLAIAQADGSSPIVARVVSPGGLTSQHIIARNQTQTYVASWASAIVAKPDWIVIDSWNDYRNGTEVGLSRQYADQYANLTRVDACQWEGQKPWAAAFLASDIPAEIVQKSLYEVHVRVENTGTLAWRKNNGYAVSYRWYTKDGTLIDDSAPRIFLQDDVPPGKSYTATVGLTALNGFGTSIDPGSYYLVFDIVQGNRRWFSYVGGLPLKIPVTIYSPDAPMVNRASMLSTSTPQFVSPGSTYNVEVRMRNDGAKTWTPSGPALTYSIDDNPAVNVRLREDVTPGAVATVNVPLAIPSAPKATHAISWNIGDPDYKGGFTERVAQTGADPGAEFGITDISRRFKTGQKALVRISVKNSSNVTWKKADFKIGYRWLYLDGVAAGHATTPPASLPGNVASGGEVVVFANVQAPEYPGRYMLLWNLVLPDGKCVADSETVTRPRETLPVEIWVTPDRQAKSEPVDLTRYFNDRGVAFEGETIPGFDGAGGSIPGEMLPPDGSSELDGDPLLIGKPGPDLYPSGYYAEQTGSGWGSNHRISFLFPGKIGQDMVVSNGQTIAVPGNGARAIHILAANSSDSTVVAQFELRYGGESATVSASIAPWTAAPTEPGATLAFKYPYRLIKSAVDDRSPCVLSDYSLTVSPGKKLTAISLPSDPRIKVLAITLEK